MGFNSYTSDFFLCILVEFLASLPSIPGQSCSLIRFIAQLTPIKITVSSVDPTAPGTALQSFIHPVF